MKKDKALAATLLAATLALTGCAAGTDPGAGSGMDHGSMSASAESSPDDAAEHGPADTMFAQMMIPHHEQAVEMSEIMLAKDGLDPRILDLANKIKAAQAPEIATMTEWLGAWGEPVEAESMGHSMEGMMTDEDLDALDSAKGDAAAELFLTRMIEHHEGAVEMAENQVAEGSNPEAVALAEQVVEDQQAEIKAMQEMLPDFR